MGLVVKLAEGEGVTEISSSPSTRSFPTLITC